MFSWIRVRGLVTATSDEDDPSQPVQHNIRVFAQVEGLDKQAIATQGDLNSGFNTREDACESGCLHACERATSSAMADDALEKCHKACHDACIMPDATGKFSAVVYGDPQAAGEPQRAPGSGATDAGASGGSFAGARSPGAARLGLDDGRRPAEL